MTTCKNCENSFEGKYCPNCSQKADTHRFTIKHFAHEFFHAFTHTDKGILFLIRELFLRPGKVAREFNAGKRKKYFNPITYLLIVMALQLYLSEKTGITDFYLEQVKQTNQPEIKVSADGQYKNFTDLMTLSQQTIQENGKAFNLLFLPILAFLTWLLFRRAGSNYAEVLVLDVLYLAQTLLIFIILCIIPFVISPQSALVSMNLYIVATFIYMTIALKQFFGQAWITTILKTIAIQLLYFVTMFVVILLVVAYFIF
jgi:hypothetical protein